VSIATVINATGVEPYGALPAAVGLNPRRKPAVPDCNGSNLPPMSFRQAGPINGPHDARRGATGTMSDGPAESGLDAAPATRGDALLKLEEFLPYRLNVVASLSSQ